MSHELRTPLNVISGYTRLVQEGLMGRVSAEQYNALDKVSRHADELLFMVSSIMNAAKIEGGALALDRQAFPLTELLEELQALYDYPRSKAVALEWDYPGDLPSMQSDRDKLKHALQNLINNALKFTDAGIVTVTVRHNQEQDTVEFTVVGHRDRHSRGGLTARLRPFSPSRQLEDARPRRRRPRPAYCPDVHGPPGWTDRSRKRAGPRLDFYDHASLYLPQTRRDESRRRTYFQLTFTPEFLYARALTRAVYSSRGCNPHWPGAKRKRVDRLALKGAIMANQTGGDVFDKEQAESLLYPARGLSGGGQLEVRMEISPDHPDPDIRGVARRVKFFNLESWHKEWTEVAKKNEEFAAGFEQENRNQTAHEFYLRAADFYRRAVVYLPETDPPHAADFPKARRKFRERLAPGQTAFRAGGDRV